MIRLLYLLRISIGLSIIFGITYTHADPVVIGTHVELLQSARQFKASVLFLGHGNKGQIKDINAAYMEIDQSVERLDKKYGKGKWLGVFGGDGYNPDKPDIAHIMKYLKDQHRVKILAIQSDVVLQWGGVDKYIDYVHYIPTVKVPVLDVHGNPVMENGIPMTKVHWGGLIDGKPKGPTGEYLGNDFLNPRQPLLKEVIAVGGGPIALEEAKYAHAHGVGIDYIRSEAKFPEVNGKFGSLDEWAKSLSTEATSRCLIKAIQK